MSIIILGMKMPTACIDCPFMVSRDGDDCILQSNEANASFLNWEQMKAGCPLVELPSHGRLGDLDALGKVISEGLAPSVKAGGFKHPFDIIRAVANAPTIIPEDPEGGADG